MSSDSFISEVSEEVRRDRLFATLRRYGWLIAAVLVLIIGGAGVLEWRKAQNRASAEAAGDAVRAAYLETDATARTERLEALAAERPNAAAIVRLAAAGSLLEQGNRDAAAAALAVIADDGAVPELYRSLAALQRVMVLGPALEAGERRALLQTLSAEGAPFRPLALEQLALMHLEAGDRAAALRELEAVLALPDAPEALLARARQLVIAAGGSLPAADLPAGAASGG